ncbi:MAG: glycosyltransferase N-terminal domain-containing protein, partial [Longimicrobiales bacterium]|nr:glycosyltransferase N-terminal domain-containing protein [Longimicrobiales bacterium]
MSLQESLYRFVLGALRGVSPLFSRGESKLARGIRGRRSAGDDLRRWGREERAPDRPLIWFHAPSVGEGFQARAVAEEFRRSRPEVQVVYTYFSPSAVSFARGMPADFRGFLPWDLPGDMGAVLDAVRPDIVAYTKTEVWPVLTREASRRDIPSLLIAATLPPAAGRTSAPGRWLLSTTFRRLRGVAAIAEEDARRFALLGVSRERVVVTGDPGIDSAAERLDDTDPAAPYLAPFHAGFSGGVRPTLVAGSTWSPDEEVLIPAVSRARASHPDLRLVVAPHEPTDDHVTALAGALERDGWEVALLRDVEERGSVDGVGAVVVDRVGVLAPLYTVGTMAYVGGGFHEHGLHSVLEPAAAGIPVLFGPKHANARAAGDLLEVGGAMEVTSTPDLSEALEGWLGDPARRRDAGDRARAYIEKHRGA